MRRSKLLKASRFVDFLRSTLSWWRSATISASREARDLKSMSGPDRVAGDRLRSFVERIERIDEDLKAMNDEKKDVFAEAKSKGFDVKIFEGGNPAQEAGSDERDERDTLLDLYLHAIETAPAQKAQAAE